MLAKAVAVSIGTRLARIQGHPDLLPSDITGVSIFSATSDTWDFRPGPVFAHVVLFDELNRTPPRSQAALLEAMEERQVTVDGESWPLPEPHLVLATQNPVDQAGTFPLVESQMDRFLLATRLGYPDEATETKLALSHGAQPSLSSLSPVCTPDGLAGAQRAVADVPVAPAVAHYAVAVVRATRSDPLVRLGASPRAAIGLLAAARAHAVISGRAFVIPDDVKAVASSVLAHRLVTDAAPVGAFDAGISLVEAILERVPSPRP
jgi:MoxR-like ATPase